MIVFVHGVPETAELWDDVRAAIDAPSVALSMPGFGCARPEGFGATKDEYVDWLLGEIAAIDEPVDLVGHDWGGGLSLRIGTKHPDAVRSWVTDVAALFHPDYEWHDFAKIWQTPGDGEAFFENQLAAPIEERAATYQLFALDEKAATKLAGMGDEVMGGCILDLYRSAVPNAYKDWDDAYGPSPTPGLVLIATDDLFGNPARSTEVAEVVGAKVATIDGAGHFWPLQTPEAGAAALETFWASLA